MWDWLRWVVLATGSVLLLVYTGTVSAREEYIWGNLPLGGGGYVTGIITCPTEKGLVYARTDVGGAYRWNEDGQFWIPLLDWVAESQTSYLGVESLAVDPNAPNRLYMLVGTGYWNDGLTAVLRSDDYGGTFEIIEVTPQFRAHGNGMGRQTGEKLTVDPNNGDLLYTGTRRNGLFRSTDRGNTWQRIETLDVRSTPNDNGIVFVLIDKDSPVVDGITQTVYAGVSRPGANLYASYNGGDSWSVIEGAPAGLMPQRAALADGKMYITYGNGAGPHGHWTAPEPFDRGAVWKYYTKTGQWVEITPPGYTRPFGGVSLDPGNADRVIVATNNTWLPQDGPWGDRILYSTDGGGTWTDLFASGLSRDYNGMPWVEGHSMHWIGSIEFDPFNPNRVFVVSGNGIWMTENITADRTTWIFQSRGVEESVPLDLVSIPGGPVITAIGDYDGSVYHNIHEYPALHNPRMGTTTAVAYAAGRPNFVVRAGKKLYYSKDTGSSWQEMPKPNDEEHGKLAVSADGEVILWLPGNMRKIYRTADLGASWTTVNGLPQGGFPVADPVNADKFYMYSPNTGVFYVSADKGQTFSRAGRPGIRGSSRIAPAPGREGDIWMALYGLMRSTDSGETFTRIPGVDRCTAVGFGRAAPGTSYPAVYIWGTVNGTTGVFRSTDEGKTWVRINDDEHQYGGPGNAQFVVGDASIYGRVYMSTAGRGTVYGEIAGTSQANDLRAREHPE